MGLKTKKQKNNLIAYKEVLCTLIVKRFLLKELGRINERIIILWILHWNEDKSPKYLARIFCQNEPDKPEK